MISKKLNQNNEPTIELKVLIFREPTLKIKISFNSNYFKNNNTNGKNYPPPPNFRSNYPRQPIFS
jgi:hypothetical protein